MSMLLEVLQPAEARKYFGVEKKRRFYICPPCSGAYHNFKERDALTAQLSPNTPQSTTVKCFVCQTATPVARTDCVTAACRGNVIDADENCCLTCGVQQDRGG
jgi:hypothetical protein